MVNSTYSFSLGAVKTSVFSLSGRGGSGNRSSSMMTSVKNGVDQNYFALKLFK